jgi:hypothetical protein
VTPPTTRSAEALLRAARVDIDREKLHTVVDHPFFISMRFKELEMRQITLEFTGDGRFAYCERRAHTAGARDVMTIYEGALSKSTGEKMRITAEGGDEDELEQQDTAGPAVEAGDCAVIEGRGTVRYERSQGDFLSASLSPTLANVERGDFRFSITVKPCFQSTEMEAWVQPLFMCGGQRQTRKHLALIDSNGNFIGEAFAERNQSEVDVSSRPNSRAGVTASLYLERMVDTRRSRPSAGRSTGFADYMSFSSSQMSRSRSTKKWNASPPLASLGTALS